VSQYQKGKTNLDFTEARESEWQWHPLGHMQVCTSLQTDNHASTPPLTEGTVLFNRLENTQNCPVPWGDPGPHLIHGSLDNQTLEFTTLKQNAERALRWLCLTFSS